MNEMSNYALVLVLTSVVGVLGVVVFRRMGNSSGSLGAKSTALEVVRTFGDGQYLKGKTAIVTGGNSGIGLETCKALAYAGCRVILCSRSVKAGEKAIEDEIKQPGEGGYIVADTSNIIVKELDLCELSSVKAFADNFLATESRLDFLVLNAGIMALPKAEYTSAGFEKQIGVNHFGHAYLTRLLEGMLRRQNFPSRVVCLSSTAHSMGDVVVEDLHFKHGRKYKPWVAYGQSKLANILFTRALADHMRGTAVTAVSVHPGVIKTALWRSTSIASGILSTIVSAFIMDKTIPQGAATTLWGCLAPGLETDALRGSYLSDCAPKKTSCASGEDVSGHLRKAFWDVTYAQLDEATKNMASAK